jgi:hypothetical protein
MKKILLAILALVIIVPLGFLLIFGTPESRMRAAFVEAGLEEPVAECMASRLSDDLSYAQLWRLSSLSVFRDRPAQDLTIGEFIDATRGLRDRDVLLLAGRAGAVCALRTRRLEGPSIRR